MIAGVLDLQDTKVGARVASRAPPPPPRAAAAASPLAPKERATTPSSGGSETAGLMGIAPMD